MKATGEKLSWFIEKATGLCGLTLNKAVLFLNETLLYLPMTFFVNMAPP
jgi:hypothetical protein